MSSPHSYGSARETNSCTEGEASGNISALSRLWDLFLWRKREGRRSNLKKEMLGDGIEGSECDQAVTDGVNRAR